MAFNDNNQDQILQKHITRSGFTIYANNLVREISPLFSRDSATHKGTINIFEEDEKGQQVAVVSGHLKIQAPNDYYMSVKHSKPFTFLTEKIAALVTSSTPLKGLTDKGLQITISRAEWDYRTQTSNSLRSFEELYSALQAIQSLVIEYQVIRDGKAFERISGHFIGEDMTLTKDKQTIELVIPPKAVNVFILEASQRAIIGADLYQISGKNPYIMPFLTYISVELGARNSTSFVMNIKDLIQMLCINTKARRKERDIVQPIKRTISEAQKHGFEIEYLSQSNGPITADDLTRYRKFYELKIQITDRRTENSDQISHQK